MSINVVRYRLAGGIQWGLLRDGLISPLEVTFATLREFIAGGGIQKARQQATTKSPGTLKLEGLEILSPVTEPCTIVCQGKNYAAHMQETGSVPQDQPFNLFFSKASSALAASAGTINRPPGVELLDYELELGLVIAQTIDRPLTLEARDLPKYIAGIVMANDVSARDIQVPEGQWFHGKSFRTFCPVGPVFCLLEPAEFERLPELQLKLSVNGSARQNGRVAQMIYPPLKTLNQLSTYMNLQPGDLILTGTPAGVAMKVTKNVRTKLAQAFLPQAKLAKAFIASQKSGRYLKDGDRIEATIRTDDGAIDLGVQKLAVVGA